MEWNIPFLSEMWYNISQIIVIAKEGLLCYDTLSWD